MKRVVRQNHQPRQRSSGWLARVGRSVLHLGVWNKTVGLICIIGLCGALSLGDPLWLGVALFLAAVFDFQKRLDDGLPLVQVAGLIAVLQWVVGPVLAYRTDYDFGRYFMRVESDAYFSYVLPATSAFLIGLHLFGSRVNQRVLFARIPSEQGLVVGLLLNGCALAAEVAARMAPSSLSFVFFLLAQLRYVGMLYLFCWNSLWKWPVIAFFLLPLLLGSAESAMFHSLLIWGGILFCYWYALRKRQIYQKWVLLLVAALGAFTIQAVKGSYRAKVWHGEKGSLLDEATTFWSDWSNVTVDDTWGNVISRMNQGWIIAAIMANVPAAEPFAEGETIVEAARSALLPRFLDPDKAGGGGRSSFLRFTGLPLGQGTAMGISPLGESYANFGGYGGIVTLFVYGGLFGLIVTYCFRYASKHPDFIFWVPLVFYQSIKAESDFVTVLNQLSKGGVLAFACYWMMHYLLSPASKAPVPGIPSRTHGTQSGKPRHPHATISARSERHPE